MTNQELDAWFDKAAAQAARRERRDNRLREELEVVVAERDRYRKALEEIVAYPGSWYTPSGKTHQTVAREALDRPKT